MQSAKIHYFYQICKYSLYYFLNFHNTDNEMIQTSLGTIMGGRGQTFKKKLFGKIHYYSRKNARIR